jgi:hypothetical protein
MIVQFHRPLPDSARQSKFCQRNGLRNICYPIAVIYDISTGAEQYSIAREV